MRHDEYKYTSHGSVLRADDQWHNPTRKNNAIEYGFTTKTKPKEIMIYHGACHAGMGNYSSWAPGNRIRFFSQLRFHDKDYDPDTLKIHYDMACRFWDAIFDVKVSPWRGVLVGFEYMYKGGRKCAFSVAVDTDTSNQLLTNLAIASRFPYEHPNQFLNFDVFVKYGMTPIQAAILCMIVDGNEKYGYTFMSANRGHHALDPQSITWTAMKSASPNTEKSKTIGRGGGYTPNNIIWNQYNPLVDQYRVLTEDKKGMVNPITQMKFRDLYEKYTAGSSVLLKTLPVAEFVQIMKRLMS